jgi:hypothetical protein
MDKQSEEFLMFIKEELEAHNLYNKNRLSRIPIE